MYGYIEPAFVFRQQVDLVTSRPPYRQYLYRFNAIARCNPRGTPYIGQCSVGMLGGLDPHFRGWLDPLNLTFVVFDLLGTPFFAFFDLLDPLFSDVGRSRRVQILSLC